MNLSDLENNLSRQNIELWFEGDKLRYRAPKGVLTPELRNMLSRNKEDVLYLLRQSFSKQIDACQLSCMQQALWFINQAVPENPSYNVAFAARIRSAVDTAALKQAFQILIDRHSILRTTYALDNGKTVQNIHRYMKVDFMKLDVSDRNEDDLMKTVTEEYQLPFNLERDPMLRVRLFRIAEQDHIILMVSHHIAVDGWSSWILVDELREFYKAEITGASLSLPSPDKKYTDFVNWESEMLRASQGKKLLAFWQKQLAGELPVLNLPVDKPRPMVLKFEGCSKSFKINKGLTQKIKDLSKTEGITIFALLLACYQVLLHRYTGQEDILTGSPVFGSNRLEFTGVVGCFINQVVIRADLSDNPTFREFLKRTSETVIDVLAHQDYPFHLMARKFWQNRDYSIPPLCQTELILQKPQRSNDLLALFNPDDAGTQIDFGGLKLENYPISQQEGQLDLTLEMIEANGSILGSLKYNSDLFNESTISRMADHFITLLESIVANPIHNISDLPIMTETERYQLLVKWNGTQTDFSKTSCIHELIETQVQKNPDAVAVIHENKKINYRRINQRANQLAHHLRILGVGPNVAVGICTERSRDMIVALLATLKAGGVYVPLDPEYPNERLSFMIKDAQVRLILTQKRIVGGLPAGNTPLFCLDTDWATIAHNPTDNLYSGVSPEDLAYIIYTSGSTGEPKGVMIQHRAMVNFVECTIRKYSFTSSDRILQFASINFDASVEEIYTCLACGATLVLRTDAMLGSVSLFLEKCREWKLTVLDLPTAYWHELTSALSTETTTLPDSLRLVIIGGEKAQPQKLRLWQESVGNLVRIVNTYGPTEATVVATMCDVTETPEFQEVRDNIPIGRPMDNVRTYILDKNQNPVPIGIPGELYIGGEGLALGYLNRTELTAKCFTPDPFSDIPNARIYKTGDLVRYRPDGLIEYIDRIDSQVKIRGFRVELEEIESELRKHPDVMDAVVTASDDKSGQMRLVAYVAADNVSDVSIQDELREHIKLSLPDYMLPSAFIVLDQLPLTPNGKIDVKALPDPGRTRYDQEKTYVAPRNSIEDMLHGIWAQILDIEKVGINDNFFEIGGHSLLATRFISQLKQELEVELPYRNVFETPTIAELSKTVEALRYISEGASLITNIDNEDREEIEI